jgi:hypothetical protein
LYFLIHGCILDLLGPPPPGSDLLPIPLLDPLMRSLPTPSFIVPVKSSGNPGEPGEGETLEAGGLSEEVRPG